MAKRMRLLVVLIMLTVPAARASIPGSGTSFLRFEDREIFRNPPPPIALENTESVLRQFTAEFRGYGFHWGKRSRVISHMGKVLDQGRFAALDPKNVGLYFSLDPAAWMKFDYSQALHGRREATTFMVIDFSEAPTRLMMPSSSGSSSRESLYVEQNGGAVDSPHFAGRMVPALSSEREGQVVILRQANPRLRLLSPKQFVNKLKEDRKFLMEWPYLFELLNALRGAEENELADDFAAYLNELGLAGRLSIPIVVKAQEYFESPRAVDMLHNRTLGRRLFDPEDFAREKYLHEKIKAYGLENFAAWRRAYFEMFHKTDQLPRLADLAAIHRIVYDFPEATYWSYWRLKLNDLGEPSVRARVKAFLDNKNLAAAAHFGPPPLGIYRTAKTYYGDSQSYPPAAEIEPLLQMAWEDMEAAEGQMRSIHAPMERVRVGYLAATRFYQALLNIHPFWDGNGRTAKILRDWVLIHWDLMPPRETPREDMLVAAESLAHEFALNSGAYERASELENVSCAQAAKGMRP